MKRESLDELRRECEALRARVAELETFERIVSCLPYGVTVFEAPTDDPGDVRYVYVNPRSSDESGIDVSGFVGKPIRETAPAALREGESGIVHAALRVALGAAPITIERAYEDERRPHRVFRTHLLHAGDRRVACVFENVTAHREAVDALRVSEERLATTIRSIGDAVIATDTRACVTQMNPIAEELTGWSQDEAIGHRLSEVFSIVDEETRRPVASPAEDVLREGATVALANNTILVTRDGRERAVSDRGAPIRDRDGRVAGVVLVCRDATQQRAAERVLRESASRYRALFEQSPSPKWVYDLETLAILAVNDEATRHYGYSREEFLAMTLHDLRVPEDVERMVASAAAREPFGVWRHRKRDGTLIDVEVHARDMLFEGRAARIVVVHDITEQRRAEAELRVREARFRALVENGSDIIFVLDADARITYASPPVEKILGVTAMEFEGSEALSWVPPEHLDAAREDLAKVLASPGVQVVTQVRMRHRNGELRDFEVIAVNRLGDPNVRGIVANLRDVTERLRAEEALKKTEERLHQAQRMEAIGTLAGGIAHDFNNLMAITLSYGEMILNEPDIPPRVRADATEIRNAATRAAELTRRLLAFSRRQVLRPSVVDVAEIVHGIEELLRRLIGERTELVTVAAEAIRSVKVDPGQLEQVLMNLVVNARDAMPNGGRVTIEASNVTLDEADAAELAGVAPGPHVKLAVRDEGVGMDPETRTRMFEPFFTTKPRGQGTGLGLSMVLGIVEQSGGAIRVRTAPGQGTEVALFFPETREVAARARQSAQPKAPQGTETLMVVEDEDAVRRAVVATLRRIGYTVLEARDGREACARLAEHEGHVHLVVTDTVMPGMNGMELAAAVAATRPSTKTILMSGYAPESLGDIGGAHLAAFLQKPFAPRALAALVREVLDAPGR